MSRAKLTDSVREELRAEGGISLCSLLAAEELGEDINDIINEAEASL